MIVYISHESLKLCDLLIWYCYCRNQEQSGSIPLKFIIKSLGCWACGCSGAWSIFTGRRSSSVGCSCRCRSCDEETEIILKRIYIMRLQNTHSIWVVPKQNGYLNQCGALCNQLDCVTGQMPGYIRLSPLLTKMNNFLPVALASNNAGKSMYYFSKETELHALCRPHLMVSVLHKLRAMEVILTQNYI